MNQLKLAALTLVIGFSAIAAEKPLIEKSSGGGFVPPEMASSESCEVHKDRVVIRRYLGGLQLEETRNITLGGDIEGVLKRAAAETLQEKDNFLCDAPGTTINAGDTLLFTSGGCGSPRKERNGSASRMLRDLVDAYCPTTHDHGTL